MTPCSSCDLHSDTAKYRLRALRTPRCVRISRPGTDDFQENRLYVTSLACIQSLPPTRCLILRSLIAHSVDFFYSLSKLFQRGHIAIARRLSNRRTVSLAATHQDIARLSKLIRDGFIHPKSVESVFWHSIDQCRYSPARSKPRCTCGFCWIPGRQFWPSTNPYRNG